MKEQITLITLSIALVGLLTGCFAQLENLGLMAHYYSNANWAGKPVKSEVVNHINFSWEGDDTKKPLFPPFGIQFHGFIFIPEPGEVTFYLLSDDGSALYLDNEMIIDNLGRHGAEEKSAQVTLTKGWHGIMVNYNEQGSAGVISLSWKPTLSAPKVVIPARYFKTIL